MNFESAFQSAARAMGLSHYRVSFAGSPGAGLMATMEADPLNCTALIRYDNELCERHNSVESTAVHECIHLLLADLKHAFESNPEAAQMEEERIVTRLEPLIYRHLFKAE